jgi:Secretion system C-terminal sorting domain
MKLQFTFFTLLIATSLAAQNVSDCPEAIVLCDKNMAVFAQTIGAGNVTTELDDALCFNSGGGVGINNESNSTWLSWTCGQSGSLTFVIAPLKQEDDIDFALYRLPFGTGNCTSKVVLRCNAAGANSFPSLCMGPTGLSTNETDESEDAGCGESDDNTFLAPIYMEAGVVYALCVNNYTPDGEGFTISFDGTGTFDCTPLQSETVRNEKDIRLFPNPTNGSFTLDNAENITNIRVFNLIGGEMKAFDATVGIKSYSLEGLAVGVYFVALRDKNGSVLKVLRVVKV